MREDTPSSRPRRARYAAGLLLGALLALHGACSKQEAAPVPPARQPAAAPATGPATGQPAAPAAGTLLVTAAKAFPYQVVNPTTDAELAKGTCNLPTSGVPAGAHLVKVAPEGHPVVTLGPAVIQPGRTTTLALAGFGSLKVKAVKDFLKFTVTNAEGKVVGKGDTNLAAVGLPVGEYSVTVAVPEFPAAVIKSVVIKESAETEARLEGFGRLRVKAVKDFLKFTVTNAEGKVVGKGDTNITDLVLPVGAYSVSVAVPDLPAAAIKGVVVKETPPTEATLEGFAALKVQASKDFLKWKVLGKGGATVAAGDTNMTSVVVPAGAYTLEVAGKAVGPLTLKSGEKKDHPSGQ